MQSENMMNRFIRLIPSLKLNITGGSLEKTILFE
jgi:hypothetical protein